MEISIFDQQLLVAQERLETIRQSALNSIPPANNLLLDITHELSVALEELQVAIEELHQQNEELIATRQQVELERQRYQDLFALAPDGYLVTDTQGLIEEVNDAMFTLFNTTDKFILGKPLVTFVVPEDSQFFYTQLNQLKNVQLFQNWDIRFKPKRKKPFPAAIAVSTIYDNRNQWIGLRWMIRDISDRKLAEEIIRNQLAAEKELNQRKTEFIHTVSHEYRTPLSTILCSAQLLKTIDCPKHQENKKQSNLERIEISVKRIVRLLEDVLIFAKSDAGKTKFKPTSIDLEKFCQLLLDDAQLRNQAQSRIHLTIRGNHASLCLDQELLEQILNNLLSNALKYSPEGSPVDFEVSCEPRQVRFRIQDWGIGILPEEQARVFETFHRGANVGTLPGTGLGLAIVKKAVDLHGGAIAIDSTVGVGTTVTVTLPL